MKPSETQPSSILVVNNRPHDFDGIEIALSHQGYLFYYATTLDQARQKLNANHLDLIIINAMMQGGISLCGEIKAHSNWQHLPILMVAAQGESQYLAPCQQAGMDDFITTPFCDLELQVRVASLLEVKMQKDQLRLLLANREAESALAQLNEQLQAMIDAVPGFVSWLGNDLRYRGVNQRLAQAFNLSPEAFVGQPLGFTDNSQEFTDFIRDFIQDSTQSSIQNFTDVNIQGVEKHFLIIAQKYDQGQSVVTVGIDITPTRQAEKQLQVVNTQLKTLVTTLKSGVLVQDKHWNIILVNQEFCNFFFVNKSPDDLIGWSYPELEEVYEKSFNKAEQFRQRNQELLSNQSPINNEEWTLRDGRFLARDYAPIIIDGSCQGHLWVYRDITEQKQCQIDLKTQVQDRTRQIENMIYFHAMTGLPSRGYLLQTIRQQLNDKKNFALLCFDCNEFQVINNCFGYEVGDALLLAIRDRVTYCLGANDVLAHLEEDNFCILARNIETKSKVERLRDIIFDSFTNPFLVEDQEIYVSISMGIVDCNTYNTSAILALRQARTALYWAKKQGKGQSLFFQEEMFQATGRKLQLVRDLRHGIRNDEFLVYYQPIIDLKHHRVSGLEALIRWQHPQEGLISPGEFIPCLEETGLIIPVGMIVLEKACTHLKTLQDYGFSDLTMSVNLSAVQFTNPNLLADIDWVLNQTQIDPTCLKLEITESVVMDNPDTTVNLLTAFRSRGIQLSIDDFGTGYSSLSYLQQFPVDTLKIDRAFVNLLDTGEQNVEIIRAIVYLGQVLGMTITAEGIEINSHLETLRELGCEYGQGYFFAKPMPAEAVFSYLGLTEKKREQLRTI
ncbi:MAG: EAL domain-containing protein [Halothece sp.]